MTSTFRTARCGFAHAKNGPESAHFHLLRCGQLARTYFPYPLSCVHPEYRMPYGAGCVTVFICNVTAVCANSLPLIDPPVCMLIPV